MVPRVLALLPQTSSLDRPHFWVMVDLDYLSLFPIPWLKAAQLVHRVLSQIIEQVGVRSWDLSLGRLGRLLPL